VVGEKKNRYLIRHPENIDKTYDLLEFFEKHQSKSATLGYINIKYGTKMTMRALTNLLTDTLLYGEYKGVPEYVDPYITKERFDRIQDILKRNSRMPANPNRVFLFSGMLKCPCCGNNMAGNLVKHSGGKYESYTYRCNTARTQKICPYTRSVTEWKVEKQLLDNLEQYITNEVLRVESVTDARPKNNNEEKARKIKAEMDRLNMMFRKGRIDEAEYDDEYYALDKKLQAIDIYEKPPERDLDALKGLLETDYRGLYSQLSKENKKAFWRNIIREFAIDENKQIIPDSIIFF